ncbi:MBL fold metallo-hydrolase [Pseudonocardia alni]|uniref:Glyoxylase-like metal-dependent hydrolase (Beta-lactamase superfamily II) n=1 Tax=Pseudonocardia alni TaxID=33907 RepID=A0AA44ZNU4_PSEA5|nr:MBL fold metallo-hydrolase [Pseudonocardia alni]PKB30233.1 glyoxylase-like metal-dependent hydrolase (beta-lactamase superfamily II) [Pseudonocardia alni]
MTAAPTVTDDDPDGDWTAPGVFRSAPGVYRIPLPLPQDGLRAVNVYALADDTGWTLIDSGWAIDEARDLLGKALAALGSGFGDVRRFLVTHAHRDHYTLAAVLRREYGTRVLLGAGERPNLEIITDPDRPQGEPDRTRLLRAGAAGLVDELGRAGPWPRPLPEEWEAPDEWIADRAAIAVADPAGTRTLTAVETPGHTRGHLVFADEAHELLFAGDHVLPRITPSIGLQPSPVASPLGQFLDSLRLVRSRPDATLLPAHGPVGGSAHARTDELLAHHDVRLAQCRDAVAAGHPTADAVARVLRWTRREHRLEDMDLFNRTLAVLETGAHLDVLADLGELRRAEVPDAATGVAVATYTA